MNKHSYPVLSEAVLTKELASTFPDRLNDYEFNFRSVDCIQDLLSLFIEALMRVSYQDQKLLPLNILCKYSQHQEMHSNSRYHLFALVQRLAKKACLSIDIAFTDFTNPSTKRWLNIFSGLINFYKYAMNNRSTLNCMKRERNILLEKKIKMEKKYSDLKQQLTEDKCKHVENEMQIKQVQRQCKEKEIFHKQFREKLAEQRSVLTEQNRVLKNKITIKDEALLSLKAVENHLAHVRYELVETSVDKVEEEVAQIETSSKRQKEVFMQRQSRSTELQRQLMNLQQTEKAIDGFCKQLEECKALQTEQQMMKNEITTLSHMRQEMEKEVQKIRNSFDPRKEQSERQDSMIKWNLVSEENEKQLEIYERKRKTDMLLMETDISTMDARTDTLIEQNKDIIQRLRAMEQKRRARIDEIKLSIAQGKQALLKFQEQGIKNLTGLLND